MRRRHRLLGNRRTAQGALALLLVGLFATYPVLAIFPQPLIGDGEVADRSIVQHRLNPGDNRDYRLFVYVDGGTFTVTKWVTNSGPVGLTITGVDAAPDYWRGLFGVKDARPAVLVGAGACCAIDEAATWAAPSFRPLHLDPGHQGAVSVRYLMGHCEDNGPGGTASFDTISVHYSILGFPHKAEIPWIAAVAVSSPDFCPRTGPARPAAWLTVSGA